MVKNGSWFSQQGCILNTYSRKVVHRGVVYDTSWETVCLSWEAVCPEGEELLRDPWSLLLWNLQKSRSLSMPEATAPGTAWQLIID